MKKNVLAAALLALAVIFAQGCTTGESDELRAVREDVETLKKNQATIRKDLDELKKVLLAKAPPRPPAEPVVSVDDDPAKGRSDALVVMVDFSDYQ